MGGEAQYRSLPEQHERHLHSALAVLSEYCRQINGLLSHGTPPPGAEPGLKPLPAEEASLLPSELKGLQASAEESVQSFNPVKRQRGSDAEATRSTVLWTSVLLEHVRDLIEEFEPKRLSRRYGSLPPQALRRLEKLYHELSARVRSCRSVVERWRRPSG